MAQVTELRGQVLGGTYRLVRPVTAGPRPVYEARHERLSGRFAVKQWPATTPWDAFRHGAELASTLRHPGVMQVLDFNCEPGAAPFLVLEWIDGVRLTDLISEIGILPIDRVAPLVESAAWALASAHQQGIVHQELRPDEVFVVRAPGTMREWVKLAGFGVSAALAHAGTAPPSRYRAPEQKSDTVSDGADPQSDQYALAAIAYEMLAGVPPFDEERSRAAPLPISDLAPGVSPAVDAAIRQALATDPELRFAGVLEFARALRDAVEGASPEALRARSAASVPPERRARSPEVVSPFFNPLLPVQPPQGRAGEVFRRVASSTARLRTLAGERGPRAPGGPPARIAAAAAVLLVAVAGTTLALRGRVTSRRPAPVPAAMHPIAAAPPPEPEPPKAALPPPAPDAAAPEVETAPPPKAAPAKKPSAKATKHAAAAKPATKPATNPATKLATKATTKPAAKLATKATTTPVAKPAPAQKPVAPAGACVMTVGSRPAADVWLDDRALGKRTPLVRFRAACGDHKLALKRTDLDLYQMEIVTLRAGAPFKKTYPLR